MNVLFVGTGSGGSWEIRGKQIGRALGARVTSRPTDNDWSWSDLVVLIKHAAEQFGAEAKASGAHLVWDVLDWWKQPEGNTWPVMQVAGMVASVKEQVGIQTLIGATQAMADEIGGVYIPHHSRPGLQPQPIRDRIEVMAYEDTPKYLGSWRKVCEHTADTLGAAFVINPPTLADADLVVAFRGEKWDGAICRRWKSGVKLANAIAAGRPVITQRSEAYMDLRPCGAMVNDPADLLVMTELFMSARARSEIVKSNAEMAKAFTLDAIAQRYRQLFDQVLRKAA